MNLTWDNAVTLTIVAVAVAYLARRGWLLVARQRGGCGTCGSCASGAAGNQAIIRVESLGDLAANADSTSPA